MRKVGGSGAGTEYLQSDDCFMTSMIPDYPFPRLSLHCMIFQSLRTDGKLKLYITL